MPGRIVVSGIGEFKRSLKAMDAGLPKQLRLVLNEAGQLVIDYAQAHIEVKTGRARASLKAQSSQDTARVALGGSKAPWAPWLDFGGEGRVKGRPAPRPYIRGGRYVYKGLEVHSADIIDVMSKGLTELAESAGLEVT